MEYYTRKYIFWQCFNGAKKRELAILPLIRGCQIRSEDEFKANLNLVNWVKNKYNLYISCAKLKDMPNFTFNIRKRKEETHPFFTNMFNDLIYEYDLFFDFDRIQTIKENDEKKQVVYSWDDVLKDVNTLKEYLDEYKVPYHTLFSGNRGIHVVVDGKYIPFEIKDKVIQPHKNIIEKCKLTFDLKTLDISGNGIPNKLRKLPYSLVLPSEYKEMPELINEQLLNVVLPLSDEDLKNFKVENMKLCNAITKYSFMNRGLLERFANLSDEQKKEGVQEFIKLFSFK